MQFRTAYSAYMDRDAAKNTLHFCPGSTALAELASQVDIYVSYESWKNSVRPIFRDEREQKRASRSSSCGITIRPTSDRAGDQSVTTCVNAFQDSKKRLRHYDAVLHLPDCDPQLFVKKYVGLSSDEGRMLRIHKHTQTCLPCR